MQNIRLLFDGIEQDLDNIQGTNGASFTYRSKDENGENGFAFSPDLLLTGAAYDYVKAQIIAQPLPALAQIKVLVYSACCSDALGNPLLLFTGKIDGADVEWCEYPCNECTVSIIDDSQDAQAIQCLKNAIIWERKPKFDGTGNTLGDDTERQAPFLSYCTDVRPSILQEFVLYVGFVFIFILVPVLGVVAAIITAINAIIAIVGGTPIGGNVSFFDDFQAIISDFAEVVTGCGYKHRTPFISSILANGCEICGISLQSSLFGIGGAYRNTMRLDAAFVAGRRNTQDVLRAWGKNRPNLNFIQFLDEFNQFNITWRVSNGVLIIERKDFDFGGQWFDLADIANDDVLSLCFSVTDIKPPAYGEYEYTKDGVDNTGDEVRDTWTDLVFDWNTPPNPAQSGLLRRSFFFGTALFRNDAARSEKSALDKPIGLLYAIVRNTSNSMLMEKGICGFPKLLIWDAISPVDNATVLRYPSAAEPNTFDYNIDWWVKESYQDGTGTPRDTLYQRLFYIDDPRVTGVKIRSFTLEINANCDILASLSPDKNIVIPVSGVNKTASISEIQYNVNTNKLTITGLV